MRAFLLLWWLGMFSLKAWATTDYAAFWRNVDGRWEKIPAERAVKGKIYARYDSSVSGFAWVTPEDLRPLLIGSQASGEELGLAGPMAKIWYTISPNGEWIVQTTFGINGRLLRLNSDGTREQTRDNEAPPPEQALPTPGVTLPAASDACYRYEIPAKGKPTVERAVSGRMLPLRLFVCQSTAFGKWVFTRTDERGRIPNPIVAMAKGTKIRGWSMNAKDPFVLYQLGRDGNWTALPDNAEEELITYVATSPPRLSLVKRGHGMHDVPKFTINH